MTNFLKKVGRAWWCVAAVAMTAGVGAQEESGEGAETFQTVDPSHAIIGATVVGPGSTEIGTVEDLVVNQQSGEVEMYLVKTNGWFGSYGVIPVDFVETRTEVPAEGGPSFLLGVRVNEATFQNLAKWDAEGSIGQYLRRYRSILATVYGLDADRLENAFDVYALAARGESDAVAMSQETGQGG